MAEKYYKVSELIAAVRAYVAPEAGANLRDAMEARVRIGGAGAHIGQSFTDKTQKARAYAVARLDAALRGEKDPYRRLLLHGVLLRVDFSYLRFLRAALDLRKTSLNLAEAHATWYTLYVHRFVRMQSLKNAQWHKSGYLLRAGYAPIVAAARARYSGLIAQVKETQAGYRKRAKRRYIIAVSEFMDGNHPLAKQTIDLADALAVHDGAEVMIVNTVIPPMLPASYFGDHTFAKVVEAFHAASEIRYGERSFAFCQGKHCVLNRQAFEWFAGVLKDFEPDAVISFGPGNLLGDAFASAVPTMGFPNMAEVPLSDASKLCTIKAPLPKDARLLKRAGLPKERIEVVPLAVRLPATQGPLDRAAFGFPSTAKIAIVVGMRLETECDDDFLSLLDAAAKHHGDLHVLFVGPMKYPKKWLEQSPTLKAKSKTLGMQDDVLSITGGADFYINPFRQGGGTSAIYALSYGKPVVTIDQGDVANIWGRACPQTPTDFRTELDRLLTDPDYFSEMSRYAGERWRVKSDMGRMAEGVTDVMNTLIEDVDQTSRPSAQRRQHLSPASAPA